MKAEDKQLIMGALFDADHLAHCSEKLLAALNSVAGAESRCDAVEEENDKLLAEAVLQQAEELRSEYWQAVQSAIYEYRKRAERARAVLA